MKTPCLSVAAAAAVLLGSNAATAQIVFSGNVGAGGTATLQIVSDIVLPVTAAGTATEIIFDEWVPSSDGTYTSLNTSGSPVIHYSLNGGPDLTMNLGSMADNYFPASSFNDLTEKDGQLPFDSISVNPGDTLRLKAGSWTFSGDADFNPATLGTFIGHVFLTDHNANRLSSSVVVPEPQDYALLAGAGLLGFGIWHRKKAANAH